MDDASELIKSKYYKTKEAVQHLKTLGKSYARNVAYASMIAIAAKGSIDFSINQFKNHSKFLENTVMVADYRYPDSMFPVEIKDYDAKNQFLIFSSEREKVKTDQNFFLF